MNRQNHNLANTGGTLQTALHQHLFHSHKKSKEALFNSLGPKVVTIDPVTGYTRSFNQIQVAKYVSYLSFQLNRFLGSSRSVIITREDYCMKRDKCLDIEKNSYDPIIGCKENIKKIGFLGRNHHLFLFYLYSVTLMGHIFIPFNYRWNKKELDMAIEDVGCEVLIVDQEFYIEYMSHQTVDQNLDTFAIDKGEYGNRSYEEERLNFPNCIHHIIILDNILTSPFKSKCNIRAMLPSLYQREMEEIVKPKTSSEGKSEYNRGRYNVIRHSDLMQRYQESIGNLSVEEVNRKYKIKRKPGDLHTIVFSSGTTSRPKGVMLSHNNQFVQVSEKLAVVGYNCHTSYLNIAPLFHIGGLNSSLAITLSGGRHIFLYTEKQSFDPSFALDTIQKWKVNTLVVVPTILFMLLNCPYPSTVLERKANKKIPETEMWCNEEKLRALKTVETVLVGGQSMSSKLLTLCKKYFSKKSNFIQTYACTEACSSISFLELDLFSDVYKKEIQNSQKTNEGTLSSPLPLNDQNIQKGNIKGEVKPADCSLIAKLNRTGIPVGFPSSIIELKIIDTKTKKPLDTGQVGEICVKGPSIMLGYHNNTTATEKAFAYRDGWLLTGDFGYIVMENLKPPRRSLKNVSSVCTSHNDTKPSLYLLGRGPDIIRSGGENISALDIENVIEELPFVQKAAVLGVADELFGERPVAICIIKGENFKDATNKANKNALKGKIMSHCQRSLSRYKSPKEILVVDTLPYTSSGKIQKHLLRSKL